MTDIKIRDMGKDDEYFVSTCSHINESDEIDRSGQRRLAWVREMYVEGLRVKVALCNGEHAGMLYMMPIEVSPWGPIGEDLMVIQCLFVLSKYKGNGIGKALMIEAEEEAKRQDTKGIVVVAYYWDFWFMPATFFEALGYEVVERAGETALLWKVFDESAIAPKLLSRRYQCGRDEKKVVVDLYYNTACLTSDVEAERVRKVVDEYGDRVTLNEYNSCEREILLRYETPRGIFVDGEEIFWGYEAPKEGVREAIDKALKNK